MPTSDINELYVQVRRRLIETGEWDHIRALMGGKLNESGWIDEVHHKSKESARSKEPLSFQVLLEEATLQAQGSVPLAVKKEISTLIRQHLEKHFD